MKQNKKLEKRVKVSTDKLDDIQKELEDILGELKELNDNLPKIEKVDRPFIKLLNQLKDNNLSKRIENLTKKED